MPGWNFTLEKGNFHVANDFSLQLSNSADNSTLLLFVLHGVVKHYLRESCLAFFLRLQLVSAKI